MDVVYVFRNAIISNDILQVALMIPQLSNINHPYVYVDDEEYYIDTPLTVALTHRHYDIAHMLLDNGANVNLGCPMYFLTYHADTLAEAVDVVERLMQGGADINTTDNNFFTYPFHEAILKNKVDFVEYYLANGADVNLEDYMGCTPLMLSQDLAMTKRLLECGADPMYVNKNGFKLCDQFSCTAYDTDTIMYLMNKGFDMTVSKEGAYSLLQRAVIAGNAELVEYLLEHDVDTTYKVKDQSAYDLAIINKKESIVKLLEKHPR